MMDQVAKMRLHLVGQADLVMNSSRLVDPLEPIVQQLRLLTSKRKKTLADHERIAEVEWHGALWASEGRPCLLADAVESCFVDAARKLRLGEVAKSALVCLRHSPLLYDGPVDAAALWNDPRFRLRKAVAVNGRRVMRTRPRFPQWAAEVTVSYLPGLLDREQVVRIFGIAGDLVGIGDWRPRYGRFRVEMLESS
ncbi:hypothetical protein TSH58p_22190 (plasmid) [Azospirillum sp. TSH58]|uniref:hypothetical protein n=1 Tax=Azospirillum sp. TSH58 TaxID=664962 RepID=UPI000D601624|nr:hypothetical protein [Azospirillum sp. TSH58]AWJ86239.1 hypothetical protein TSH58p_22190 [Azospirillum sp. TSH58]